MRYARLLDATNSISELQEFVEASLLCWELRVPFGTYNMTNPGTVTTREVVDLIKKAGLCDREFIFFDSEDDFMRTAAIAPRSNCVMNSDKLRNAGIRLTEVHEAIERDLRNWTKIGSAEPLLAESGDPQPNPRTRAYNPQITQMEQIGPVVISDQNLETADGRKARIVTLIFSSALSAARDSLSLYLRNLCGSSKHP